MTYYGPTSARRDDQIYHEARELEIEPRDPKLLAEREMQEAWRGVKEWDNDGLMAPMHAQERLHKARIALAAAGLVEYGMCSVCRGLQIGKQHEHVCE